MGGRDGVGGQGRWHERRHRRTRGGLRVTFVDVGQGDAALVDLPDGRLALIDTGQGDPHPAARELEHGELEQLAVYAEDAMHTALWRDSVDRLVTDVVSIIGGGSGNPF